MSWKTNGKRFLVGARHFARRQCLGKVNEFDCLCHSCEGHKDAGECILTGNRPGPTSTGWVCKDCRVEEGKAKRAKASKASPDPEDMGD